MTSETTSMQYTHDTSDGRNRLIWTKDQDNNVTIYGYGAEGIVWSLCNGEYMFYHYDYRGSVIAVTDIDGTVTDTVKYDVYGAVAARTGDSELILGYNGEYGVLTDPSGLLYMRTRYYSTELKRFLSADVINGSIADSTTLNLYAYVNGNPISFIDPFGLCRQENQGVGLNYNGNFYPIYVPNSYEDYVNSDWKTVYYDSDSDLTFDWAKFITGIEFEEIDRKDLYAGKVLVSPGTITDKSSVLKLGGCSILAGILNSANENINSPYVNLEFQENGDQKRVIITAGSSSIDATYDACAGHTESLYWNAGDGRVLALTYAASFYQNLTGNDIDVFATYDVVLTVDSRHKIHSASSYLSITNDGILMETPIIFADDKVEVGTRGFLGFGFTPLASAQLGGSMPVASEYQSIFDKLLESYKLEGVS